MGLGFEHGALHDLLGEVRVALGKHVPRPSGADGRLVRGRGRARVGVGLGVRVGVSGADGQGLVELRLAQRLYLL